MLSPAVTAAKWCQVLGATAGPAALRTVPPSWVTSTNGTPLSAPRSKCLSPALRLKKTAPGCGAPNLIHVDQVNAVPSVQKSEAEAGTVTVVLPSRRRPPPIIEPAEAS